MAEAAAKSLAEGKSPKLVSSDHCHISTTEDIKNQVGSLMRGRKILFSHGV